MKTFLYNCSIPLIIVIVVGIQMYNVRNHHLTPWKGGGFGMYSTLYWRHREIWFYGLPNHINPLEGFETEANYIRQYPSDNNIKILADKVKEKHNLAGFSVEIWEPIYHTDGTLTRVQLKKVYVP